MPYKALDGVVDDLSRYLASIPRQDGARLMPPEAPALTQVFPVLLQVGAIEDARRDQELGNLDPLGLRRRAFGALRDLLGRLADRQLLVVCSIDNNHEFRNPGGRAATFSSQGLVDLTGEYFKAQGTNGRSCASCHIPEEAWSINPGTLQRLFDETNGTAAIFNPLDANNPTTADFSTVEGRRAAYSMLLSRGVVRRGGALKAEPREWDLIAAEDPHGFANPTRLVHWRRVMPTINFAVGSATVNWDGGNTVGTDQHAGLVTQAKKNVLGPQQGTTAATAAVIANIVDFETSLSTAQLIVPGVGRLDSDGAWPS